MEGILLMVPQGKTLDGLVSMLSGEYETLPCEGLPDDNVDNIAAVLVDLDHDWDQGILLGDQMKAHSFFSDTPLLGLTASLPREREAACIEHGFFDIISLPCPRGLLLKRIRNAVRASESLTFHEMEKMLKQLPSNIFLKDAEGRYVFSTQYWHHLYHADEPNWSIRGKTDLEIRKDKQNAQKAMEADRKIIESGQGTNYIIEEKEDGTDEFLELIKRPVYDSEGRVSGIIALINDVTEQHLLKMELEKRSQLDPLTELLNKRSTETHIRMMLESHENRPQCGAMLMIDVDNFKVVNDSLGHAVGDRVLVEIARIIRTNFRVMDVTGRIGGDEFMVFLRDTADIDAVRYSAKRFQDQVRTAFEDLVGGVSLSVGIALYPSHGTTFDELYRAADKALYAVKKHCKGTYLIYSPEK